MFLTSPSDRSRSKTENITCSILSIIRITEPIWISETNQQRFPPMYYNESQNQLYLKYIEVLFLMLSSDFHEEFSYNGKCDQRKRKGQDGNESSIKVYHQADDTRWNLLQGKYKWQKVWLQTEGRRGWFTIFHVKATKKVTSILRLRKKVSFFGLKDLETKKIMQMS